MKSANNITIYKQDSRYDRIIRRIADYYRKPVTT